ncbi:MAG: hypothetical protein HY756_04630 [Nitrospirae bacterium]|nr:hypothetical protein [Nitrospirota bacterium]
MDEISSLRSEIKRLKKALSELTPPLETLLNRRGFKVHKKEPSDDLLIPTDRYINSFYKMMKRYSFRLFLRDVIKHQISFTIEDVAKYATNEITREYIGFLKKAGLIRAIPGSRNRYRLIKGIKSFGETLEWFMARLIEEEFGAKTIWGVKFKRAKVGGDYDLIAKIDSSLLYMEVKSSPPKQIYDKEIKAFMDRVLDLSPDISIFFMDTELRMKDKIVPMFEAELKRRYKKETPVERIEKELFHIRKKVFIINSKDSIEANIRTALNLSLFRKRGI